MLEVQDIFCQYGAEYLEHHSLSPTQAKAFRAIQNCRTAVLGAHLDTCNHCGFTKISYNSCRNRHCPKCQAFSKEQWIEKQNSYLLNTDYFHVVFTVPNDLNSILLRNQQTAYTLFFKVVSQTILELCSDRIYLGATPGITAVLHTWGQNLAYYPHIHCIVTGGGLTASGKWKSSRKKFFLPVKVLARKFRGKFLAFLKLAGFSFPQELYHKDWIGLFTASPLLKIPPRLLIIWGVILIASPLLILVSYKYKIIPFHFPGGITATITERKL